MADNGNNYTPKVPWGKLQSKAYKDMMKKLREKQPKAELQKPKPIEIPAPEVKFTPKRRGRGED